MAEKHSGNTANAHPSATQSLHQPSIKDIARLARVSHPTVSRALQNSPLVNPHTAARIRKIAAETGYRASAVARGLVTRRTRTIGLMVTTVADPFAGEVVCGVEQIAGDHGYAVFLAASHADPEREKEVAQSLAERRVDGIIVAASRIGAHCVPLLREMHVPIVLLNGRYPGSVVHSILIGNRGGACAATAHLIGLGHRRIAYLGDKFGYQSDAERFAGYRAALDAARIPFASELAVHADGTPVAAGVAMDELLSLADPPTAVCCCNDMSALGAMRSIRLHGLRVPADISITGFDDLFFAAYLDPPLTSVRQPMRRIGQLAMESLFKLMSGEEPAAEVHIETELVVRASTAAVRKRVPEKRSKKLS